MKKKTFATVVLFAMIAAGCGNGSAGQANSRVTSASNGVEAVLQQEMAKEDGKNGSAASAESLLEPAAGPDPSWTVETSVDPLLEAGNAVPQSDVDVDLTLLSSTMVYTQVYDMVVYPSKYIGKTVRMEGLFTTEYSEETKLRYYACVIQDATACCAQGIEFELSGDYKYPEDYPEIADDICVVGEFDTYMEGENLYCTLRNAKMEKR